MKNKCSVCKKENEVSNYEIKGSNSDNTKILFILHKADSRVLEPTLFEGYEYQYALDNSLTGKIITQLLDFSHLSPDDVYITNFIKCLLPEDREPNKEEYSNCLGRLEKQVLEFQPRKIIAFGHKTCEYMFPENRKVKKLSQEWGTELEYNSIPTMIAHHPCYVWKYPQEKKECFYQLASEFLHK